MLAATVLLIASAGILPVGAQGGPHSLYQGASPRPGPDALYWPLATAPQLTNAGIWHAPPILVSGTTAYRQGEFLYQDWMYDDRGAAGGFNCCRDSGHIRNGSDLPAGNGGENLISPGFGTYTYPQTRPTYAENAADLVELRVKPTSGGTAFRVTLNTLTQQAVAQDAVAFTIALARCPGGTCPTVAQPFPHGANAHAPADVFLTVHGSTGELLDRAFHPVGSSPVTVAADLGRRQIEARVPKTDWDPAGGQVRTSAGVGLWNAAAGGYFVPQQNADTIHPGGLGNLNPSTASAFFNIAFRDSRQGLANSETFHPLGSWADPNHGVLAEPTYWRDYAQGLALRSGDLGPFHADINFSKLAQGATDNSQVPTTGAMDRIFSSHWDLGQGVDFNQGCNATSPNPCPPEYKGQLQPYAVYIPAHRPASGYGMTLLPHSLSANYNQYYNTNNQSAYGDRDGVHGSIVITTEDRGPDEWYHGFGGADPFEAWADVAARFPLDAAYTDIGGYSMGGYATYKFTTQYPDLFAAAHPTVGPPAVGIWVPPLPPTGGDYSNTNRMVASLRNVPFLMWNTVNDELVPYAGAATQANTFDQKGYRYQFWSFAMPPGLGHLGLGLHDNFNPGADFLGTAHVDRNPAHVTYVRNPKMDYPQNGTTADHAYWLSGVTLRDGSGTAPLGTIDVRSEAFGSGDPPPLATTHGAGVLNGTIPLCCTYDVQAKSWGPAPAAPVADVLDINAQNISDVTVNVRRAHVDCHVVLNIVSDGPVTVHLSGCGGSESSAP